MNMDEKFKKNWEGIRKKGFVKYFFKCALESFVGIILVRLFFNKNSSSLIDPTSGSAGVFVGTLFVIFINWERNEERYKKLK